jgi:hypothetical protein
MSQTVAACQHTGIQHESIVPNGRFMVRGTEVMLLSQAAVELEVCAETLWVWDVENPYLANEALLHWKERNPSNGRRVIVCEAALVERIKEKMAEVATGLFTDSDGRLWCSEGMAVEHLKWFRRRKRRNRPEKLKEKSLHHDLAYVWRKRCTHLDGEKLEAWQFGFVQRGGKTKLWFGGSKRWRVNEVRAWVEAGCPDRKTWATLRKSAALAP